MAKGRPTYITQSIPRPLSTAEVARFLGLERKERVYELVEMRELSCRKVHGKLYFDPYELLRYDNNRGCGPLREG